jgi:hypothetical protein
MSMLKRCVTSGVLQPFFVIASSVALLASSSASSAQSKSTNIEVSSAVAQSKVDRLGVTLGGETWVDGGRLRKNLVVNNPGLEAADYRAVLRCEAATADGCLVSNAAPAEPAGFWTGARYQIMSGGAAPATGTVMSYTSGEGGPVLVLDKNLKLSAGDYFSVEVLQPVSEVAGWSGSTSGGGMITAETADLSPETSGKQAMLLSALARGGSVRLSQEMDSQPNRSELRLNGAYEVCFRAKGVGGNNQLNVSVTREASGNAAYLNRQVALTDSWAQYTLSFSAAETGTQSSPLQLSFAAAGANIELDDVSLQQSNSSSANATAYRDEVVNALQDLHPGTIRMVSGGSDVLTLLAGPFARYNQGVSSELNSAPGRAFGIQEFLQLCATVGADPWITVPSATTPAEMTDLVQYLTGNGSDTWSGLRIARGQVEPWTSVFGKVHIELENATGISGPASEPMAPSAYADWSDAVFGAARRSTAYSTSKFDLILSGSAASTEWNAAVLSASTQQDSLSIAPSLLLSNDQSQRTQLGALFAEPELFNAPGGEVFINLQAGAAARSASGRPTQINVTDSALSSIAGANTQAQLRQLTPSRGLGIAQANYMLQMMRSGVRYQNASVLAQNDVACSDGSPANCRHPELLIQALANRAIGGNMLQTVQSGANPTWTQKISERMQVKGEHLLQSFAFANGADLSAVVFNLSQTASLPVTFSGIDAPAGTVQVTQTASADTTGNNETENAIEPSAQTLSGFNAASGLSLPPHSMTVLSWTPTAEQAADATLSSPFEKSGTTLKLSPVAAVAAAAATPASAQPVIDCASGFAATGSCGVSVDGYTSNAFIVNGGPNVGAALSGSRLNMLPAGSTHSAVGLIYQTQVNVQAFSSTFTFVPNGWNIAFVVENNTNSSGNGGNPRLFTAGAGCEAGFYQAFDGTPPNNILGLELDQQSSLTNGNVTYGAPFTYSSVQIYQQDQSPCNPNDGQPNYYYTQKISTSPVSLNSPASTIGTTTGDIYSVTLSYNGTNLVMTMYDVTAGGSCPGSSCFTQTWTGVDIPALVGSNTAYVGLTGGTNSTSSYPLYVNSLVYTVLSSAPTAASTPTFSPGTGTYTSSQSVSIGDSTPGSTIYYTTNGATPTTSSSVYSGPITVSSTETLHAIAAASGYTNSSMASATYIINSIPAMPTFSVEAGTYTSTQTVSISDATSGATIYYTTNGTTPTTSSTKYSGAITVSSSETLEAVATVADPTMSAVASATYVIDSPSINYPSGGFKASSFDLNGGATVTADGLLQLTDGGGNEARSAWFATKVPVQTFTTDFTFEQLNAAADGITFTIQGQGPAALGGLGGSLGYQGITNSVAVKFDLYNNDGEGIDSTGLYTSGAAPTVPSIDLSSTPINLHSGDVMHAHMVYDGTNLTMTLTDTATGGSVVEVLPVNIPSLVGGNTAYIGFTGGTGGAISTQNVLSWTYSVGGSTPTAATPKFSVAAGTYSSAQTVSISDATPGATIYYTTDGTTPTTSSTKYSGAITVSSTETLEAVATVGSPALSAVASATYVIESLSIDYPSGGFNASSFDLNGGASVTTGGLLQLTDGADWEGRSAWFATKVPVQTFTTDFTFEQLNATADGITFTIQGQGPTALGSPGISLGYQGITNSVAVKFDLYNNAGEGIDSTGLFTGGAQPTVPSIDLSSTPINLHSGDVMYAHLVYDGVNLTMTLTDTATGGSVIEVLPVNIPSLVGGNTAYVGFTGGTGGLTSTQTVLSWTFTGPAVAQTEIPSLFTPSFSETSLLRRLFPEGDA